VDDSITAEDLLKNAKLVACLKGLAECIEDDL